MGCLASDHRRAVQESDSNGQLCLDVTIMCMDTLFDTKAEATVRVNLPPAAGYSDIRKKGSSRKNACTPTFHT